MSSSSHLNIYATVSAGNYSNFLKPVNFTLKDGSIIYGSEGGKSQYSQTLLLVHGLASNRKMWDECAMHLVNSGYRVISIDLRHHGESFQSSISTDFTLESYSNDIVEIITSLNASNPYENDRKQPILCGQSWGASIVLNVGLNFPHLVNGIVCVDGGYIDLQRSFPQWEDCEIKLKPPDLSIAPNDIVNRVRGWYPEWSHFGIEGMIGNFYQEPLINNNYTLRLKLWKHMQLLKNLWDTRPSEKFSGLKVPILLLPSGVPSSFSKSKDEEIQALKECVQKVSIEWFKNNGHDLHTENPYSVANVISRHIDSEFFLNHTY